MEAVSTWEMRMSTISYLAFSLAYDCLGTWVLQSAAADSADMTLEVSDILQEAGRVLRQEGIWMTQ